MRRCGARRTLGGGVPPRRPRQRRARRLHEIPAPAPDCDPGEDADGDGWTCDNPRAPDCDDGDPTVNPGALDVEDDGVDADCLGGDALPATPGVSAGSFRGAPALYDRLHRIAFDHDVGGFPASIRRTDVDAELLWEGSGDDREHGLGVAVFPQFHTTADASNVTTSIERFGPVLATVAVTWSRTTPPMISGTARFHLFPDGRLRKHEVVTVPADFTGGGLYFASFNAFDRASFDTLRTSDGGEVDLASAADGTIYGPGTPQPGWTCATGAGGRTVGMSWIVDLDADGLRAQKNGAKLALEHDWVRNGAMVPAGIYAATTVLALSGEPGCDAVAAAAADLSSPATLLANGFTVPYVVEEGVYQIFSGEPYVEFVVDTISAANTVVLDAWVEDDVGVTVWRNGERLQQGSQVLVQRELGRTGELTLGFPTPLDAGDVIRVAPPGQEPPG